MSIWQPKFLFWIIFFGCLSSCDFLHFFIFFLSILLVIISLELTRVNPNRYIFSINGELTFNLLLYRGLVHHHHRILNHKALSMNSISMFLLLLIDHFSLRFLCKSNLHISEETIRIKHFSRQKHDGI